MATNQRIRITLHQSLAGNTKRHAANLAALGLRKRQHTVEHDATPDILGKVHYVKHMVTTELVDGTKDGGGKSPKSKPAKAEAKVETASASVEEAPKPKATKKKKSDAEGGSDEGKSEE